MTPEQEVTDDGIVHPKIEISEVVFQLKKDHISINTMNSDLPLYKAHKYEEGVKNWLISHLSEFEKDMKIAM